MTLPCRWFFVAVLLCLAAVSKSAESARTMLKLEIDGQQLEGLPLAHSSDNVILLERDGQLREFDPNRVSRFQQTTTAFESYSLSSMQNRLREEFGKAFEVTSTGHYLVVHPRGQGSKWSRRFEELYRSFVHYFSVRGFDLDEPRFPLVAVVLKNRQEFERYTLRDGKRAPPGLLGFYTPANNRVALYDLGEGRDGGAQWGRNAETIIHEATHQTAFNTGVHSRFTPPPRWVVEGLGTMFEAPGVWNSRSHTRAEDRLNRERLAQFKQQLAAGQRPEARFAALIASDRPFESDSQGAYAEAWAFTFYLVETQPRLFAKYLKRTANHPDFTDVNSAARLKDFTSVFGENFRLIDAQFLRYMQGLGG